MSTIVADIQEAILAQCATTLGATWQLLPKVYEPNQANARAINKAYGVLPRSASNAPGVIRTYNLDHRFEVLLVDRVEGRDNDSGIQTKVNGLFEKGHEIYTALALTRVGLTNVLLIDQLDFSDPEILDNGGALLRLSFNVKYRQPIA